MASKTVVELVDDLDGGRADETVRFALDGVDYELDLSAGNAARLRDVLADYVRRARKVTAAAARSKDAVADPAAEAAVNARPAATRVAAAARPTRRRRREPRPVPVRRPSPTAGKPPSEPVELAEPAELTEPVGPATPVEPATPVGAIGVPVRPPAQSLAPQPESAEEPKLEQPPAAALFIPFREAQT